MNLAVFKYRSVMCEAGGPISRLATRFISAERGFEAFAYLNSGLRPIWLSKPAIYGRADGSGSHQTEIVASYIAISEALERWAFYSRACEESHSDFGFDIDKSTSGMAAFPAFTYRAARERAYLEAVERWSVCAWWEGKVSTKPFLPPKADLNVYRLAVPWDSIEVVILHKKSKFNCYAFAAARTTSEALDRAMVELNRNIEALARFSGHADEQWPAISIESVYEKRLMFFASTTGFQKFQERIKGKIAGVQGVPKLLIDCEVEGPWTRYAQVWRCLFEPVSDLAFSAASDYFLF